LKFENFLEDMGERPERLTLERKDNDGDYEPGNCVWADRTRQARNRSSNRVLEIRGVKKTLIEWVEESKLDYFAVLGRLNRGWDPERAVSQRSNNRMGKRINENNRSLIRRLYAKGNITYADLAKEFDVNESTICRIVREDSNG
jgi:hypothetical protein